MGLEMVQLRKLTVSAEDLILVPTQQLQTSTGFHTQMVDALRQTDRQIDRQTHTHMNWYIVYGRAEL